MPGVDCTLRGTFTGRLGPLGQLRAARSVEPMPIAAIMPAGSASRSPTNAVKVLLCASPNAMPTMLTPTAEPKPAATILAALSRTNLRSTKATDRAPPSTDKAATTRPTTPTWVAPLRTAPGVRYARQSGLPKTENPRKTMAPKRNPR